MAHLKRVLPTVLFMAALLSACRQQATPTPTLAPPPTVTVAPEGTPAAPHETATPPPAAATEVVASPSPTAAGDVATPTLAAEPSATVEASPSPQSFEVHEPADGAQWSTGSAVSLSGRAPAGAASVDAALRAAGLELAFADTTPASSGDWQLSLEVPSNVTGSATVHFTLDGEPAEERLVQLALPGATSGPAISLAHPQFDSTVVAGHVLFFTGSVQRPPDGMLTIAVLYEECQTTASTTTFNVGEGGQWWGYIVVPETVFGPACAVAYLGEFDGPDWLAAHAAIDILEADDPQARGVFIGNFAGSELTPGESVRVYGSAFNPPNNQVRVALEVGGEMVAQGTTSTDRFGYWEINLVLPAAAATASEGQFSATVSYAQGEITEIVPFAIAP